MLKNIAEVAQQLDKRLITTFDVLKMCLQKIENTKQLNAFITINHATMKNDKLSEPVNTSGQNNTLKGIPIAIKDNFCTKGVRTTCASKMLSNFIPPYNASIIQKLENCGAIMIGKTNMDEFSLGSGSVDSFYGPVKNPWRSKLKYRLWKCSQSQFIKEDNTPPSLNNDDDFFIAGGSSGGSAVAVATGCCFGALGSDTGGSTRMPAALCGIVGLKPTYGLLSRHGLVPVCNSFDVPGIMTRSVDDAALLLNCMQGYDPYDSTTCRRAFHLCSHPLQASVKELNIGIPKEYNISNISAEVSNLWASVADMLENAGAKITPVSLPYTEYSVICYSIINCCEVASNFARYDGLRYGHRSNVESSAEELFSATRYEGFGNVVKGRILAGNYFLLRKNFKKYYIKAAQVRRLISDDFKKVFNSGIDVLLTPVTLSDATLYSEWIKKSNRENTVTEDYFTQPANLAGLPAVSIPCKLSSKGLPLGLQLIGQPFQEETILNVAKFIETNLDFPFLEVDSNQASSVS